MKLLINALTKFICGVLLVGIFLFIPAGTPFYKGGLLFMGVLFIPIFIMGLVLLIKSPDLLKKRIDGKEKETAQKGVVAYSAFVFIIGFVLAGLDFRFNWSDMPQWVSLLALAVFLLAYVFYAEVMRENAYLSRKIEVQENQKLVDTGLYGIVRHPMYIVTIVMFLMIPLILGSWFSLLIFIFYPALIVIRINNEEEILTKQLEDYAEYKQKVKYRLIPFIW